LPIEPAALTTYQIGIVLLMLAVATDYDGITRVGAEPRAVVGLVIGLGIVGTGVAYILYYVIVERLGAIRASSATYIPPVVALVIGWALCRRGDARPGRRRDFPDPGRRRAVALGCC
jgi:drug/metabolite transporter (DMT)-like permease